MIPAPSVAGRFGFGHAHVPAYGAWAGRPAGSDSTWVIADLARRLDAWSEADHDGMLAYGATIVGVGGHGYRPIDGHPMGPYEALAFTDLACRLGPSAWMEDRRWPTIIGAVVMHVAMDIESNAAGLTGDGAFHGGHWTSRMAALPAEDLTTAAFAAVMVGALHAVDIGWPPSGHGGGARLPAPTKAAFIRSFGRAPGPWLRDPGEALIGFADAIDRDGVVARGMDPGPMTAACARASSTRAAPRVMRVLAALGQAA